MKKTQPQLTQSDTPSLFDYYAVHAPESIPGWFDELYPIATFDFEKPVHKIEDFLTKPERLTVSGWQTGAGSNSLRSGAPEEVLQIWSAAKSAWQEKSKQDKIDSEHSREKRYMAWRIHYAHKMLAERDEQATKPLEPRK